MIELIKYAPEFKTDWDDFIRKSKNGTFILFRDYIEYHSNRFHDYSLLFRIKGKLKAVLPGNISDDRFYSHQGLTYGGLICSHDIRATEVIEIFKATFSHLKKEGVKEITYKPSPYIYHKAPAQEDLYAIFKLGAEKSDVKISSTIYQANKNGFIESRNGGVRKSKKSNIIIRESDSYDFFWDILNENLLIRYNTKPVHTLSEILYLKSKFPENIRLYTAEKGNIINAGVVLYLNPGCAHVQYIGSNEIARKNGALDLLFETLINEVFTSFKIFDFGTSNGAMGQVLVEDLLFQKEGFGGRGVVYETYKLTI